MLKMSGDYLYLIIHHHDNPIHHISQLPPCSTSVLHLYIGVFNPPDNLSIIPQVENHLICGESTSELIYKTNSGFSYISRLPYMQVNMVHLLKIQNATLDERPPLLKDHFSLTFEEVVQEGFYCSNIVNEMKGILGK